MLYKASAPGSLMLLGEYAVLYGKSALVCAVNKRITVSLQPRGDKEIHIHSSKHGVMKTTLTKIEIARPFQFVLAALKGSHLKTGCDINIESEFSDQVGLGSSAAVTVATLAAIYTWQNISVNPLNLLRDARRIIRQVQGLGSGADAAAAVYGGMVAYHAQPLTAEKLPALCPISLVYSGAKTPTVEAVKHVQTAFTPFPDLFQQICKGINACAQSGIAAARRENWAELAAAMNIQQGFMHALGVNTPVLQGLVDNLRLDATILGAKISGSGLGDCVVALGSTNREFAQRIAVEMDAQGVRTMQDDDRVAGIFLKEMPR